MTPEEAWQHVRALFPDVVRIDRFTDPAIGCWRDSGILVRDHFLVRISPGVIQWPEGVTRWPPEDQNGESRA